MAAITALLQRDAIRLVTLTGPGGIGKTRLALAAGAASLAAFADGVFFVELASLADPERVPAAIAQALGVREIGDRSLPETLAEHLIEKQTLLILDNFEHLLDAAPVVATLLASAPRLKVLATSRAPLHLHGEQELPVAPLALPDRKQIPSHDALSQYAAVALFIQRALAVKPEFAVTNENAPAVAEICHRLDGLPLAIELAAARVKLLSPQLLLARLERRLPLLTGGARDLPARHQTLRAAIAWSHDLLSGAEQRLFRRLSVFAGGGTLEAVEAVCGGAEAGGVELLEQIAALVDQSLVRQEEDGAGEIRLTMLETIREFAHESLVTAGEAGTVSRQHAECFLAMGEAANREADLPGRGLDRVDREQDNLRAALRWSIESGRAEVGLRLACALQGYWLDRGSVAEGRSFTARLLALPTAAAPTLTRARALGTASVLALRSGDDATARSLAEARLELARGLGDAGEIANGLFLLGVTPGGRGGSSQAISYLEESLAIRRERGDEDGVADCLNGLGGAAYRRGDFAVAKRYYGESLALQRRLGLRIGSMGPLQNLGLVAEFEDDYDAARGYFSEALTIARELGVWGAVIQSLWHLGMLAQNEANLESMRACFEEVLALAESLERPDGVADACLWLGRVAHLEGDYAAARAWRERSLALARECGADRIARGALIGIGEDLCALGRHEAGAAHFREALILLREVPDGSGSWKFGRRGYIARCLEGLARGALDTGNPECAARRFAAAAAIRQAIGLPLPAPERPAHERHLTAVAAAVGPARFANAWAEGEALSMEDAVTEALSTP